MRRTADTAFLMFLAPLAACQPDEVRNIQAEAEETARMLENRAKVISAEADNSVNAAADILDNQAAALANQADALREIGENLSATAGNKQ